jgi:hypothetical protein
MKPASRGPKGDQRFHRKDTFPKYSCTLAPDVPFGTSKTT